MVESGDEYLQAPPSPARDYQLRRLAPPSIRPHPSAHSSTVSESAILRAFYGTAFPRVMVEQEADYCIPWRKGDRTGSERFNALAFFPDHPDEMRVWPKGGIYPLRVLRRALVRSAVNQKRFTTHPNTRTTVQSNRMSRRG